MRNYIGLIHKGPGSDYGVSFPMFRVWRRLAKRSTRRALWARRPLPCAVMVDLENKDGVAVLVPLKAGSVTAVRVNVTLPGDILARMDQFTESHGLMRSGFLARAAEQAMKEVHGMEHAA
jgi:hypothetical protein